MKKLLLVGNKVESPEYRGQAIPLDLYTQRIDEMDFVCRVNRMLNYGTTTGTKVDGLYIGGWQDFDEIYHGGEHTDIMKTIPQIFVYGWCWARHFKKCWQKYITQEQKNNFVWCDFDKSRIRIDNRFSTSSVCMIDFFCNEKPWCDEYNIWFTGLDVDNRGEILLHGEPWKDNQIKYAGYKEEAYLRKLMADGRLHWLEQDIYEQLNK